MQRLVETKHIRDASYHIRLHRKFHAYVWPFALLYPTWAYIYFFKYDAFLGSIEMTFVSFVSLASLNMLTFLMCQWSINIKALLTCRKVLNPFDAEVIKIIPQKDQGSGLLCPLIKRKINLSLPLSGDNVHIHFMFQQKKFIYDHNKKHFVKLDYPVSSDICFSLFKTARGFQTDAILEEAMDKYGNNLFEIPLPTFKELFKEHSVAPFFVFQIFCVILWMLDEYWYYSLFTLFMLVGFESMVVFQRLKSLQEMRSMSQKPYDINVYRKNQWTTVKTDQLIPGDICSVVRSLDDSSAPCDMLIVEGSCIVNEAMLSGESIPQVKESVALREDDDHFDVMESDKIHCIFGGTKILQVTASSEKSNIQQTPDNGCIAYVLRTGFGTTQGKLVRTILYGTERMTANNLEAFMFILFLLVFAIIAAGYVWVKGNENELRKRSKLILDCILIITSVVPPELPMELSLAVNNSLVALVRYAIFCTEPFRIPFAGKVDICCFDKTGTLTGEELVVQGVAFPGPKLGVLKQQDELHENTVHTLVTCHGLVNLDNEVIGDSMEKATVMYLGWTLQTGDIVLPKSGLGKKSFHILRRFQFSSALKRMSTISVCQNDNSGYFVSVKGAPEVLRKMFNAVPKGYDDEYKYWARQGSRVLALGFKRMSKKAINSEEIRHIPRESVEENLEFAGFMIFHCPLKEDAKDSIVMLNNSSHRTVMITGDNPLTACHVAKEVQIVKQDVLILDGIEGSEDLQFKSIDESVRIPIDSKSENFDFKLLKNYDLCATGRAINQLEGTRLFEKFIPLIWIYARVSPSHKELIIRTMKKCGYVTLMCGDGTNDVGALRQADIGIALLDGTPEDLMKIQRQMMERRKKEMLENQRAIAKRFGLPMPPDPNERKEVATRSNKPLTEREKKMAQAQKKVSQVQESMANSLLQDLDDEVPTLKFGDASVAAAFTSKLRHVKSVCQIVRQGRCTLVTTIQMYKILALNCLITAFSLSVLYLAGIKYGDIQVTISGMLLTVCFLCISRGKPLEELSKKRPQPNIFNFYILLSVLGQFFIHIASLYYVMTEAQSYNDSDKPIDLDGEFEPSLLNSGVYLISLSMQVSTFVINYQGRPFRESLKDNKALYYGLTAVAGVALSGATEFIPELNSSLQLVPFPGDFSLKLTAVMLLDFGGAYLVELVTSQLFSDFKPKKSLMLE